ncbi:hypothetical protein [Streptomyces sp. NPDC018045]|uniref:hypothetical protein n=1 Tax=Streptomyces sp. NPDC018045 TaxID=3365037 RepID=UPI0037AA62FF
MSSPAGLRRLPVASVVTVDGAHAGWVKNTCSVSAGPALRVTTMFASPEEGIVS